MFTDSALLEGAWGNNPHYCSLHWHRWERDRDWAREGGGWVEREGEREQLAAVLFGCLSLWSAPRCERRDPTCPNRCSDSSNFLCGNACVTSQAPPPRFSFCLCQISGEKKNNFFFLFAVTGWALWSYGGDGGERSAWQPVHGGELGVPEHSSSLHPADQWDFPQWGHESHVRPINTLWIYCLGYTERKYNKKNKWYDPMCK